MIGAWGPSEREAYARGVEKGESKIDDRALASIAESLAKIVEMMTKDREPKA